MGIGVDHPASVHAPNTTKHVDRARSQSESKPGPSIHVKSSDSRSGVVSNHSDRGRGRGRGCGHRRSRGKGNSTPQKPEIKPTMPPRMYPITHEDKQAMASDLEREIEALRWAMLRL